MVYEPRNGEESVESNKASESTTTPDDPRMKVVDRRWWARGDQDLGEDSSGWEPRKPTYIEDLEKQLADKDQRLQNYIGQYKQAAAEFEDAKARVRRDVAKDVERGRRVVLIEMLDVLDNLQRASAAAHEKSNFDTLLQGLDMIERLFAARLEGFGLTPIAALGRKLDPTRHEAVSTVPTANADEDDTVVGIVRPGYMIGDEVLRPALVAVAKHVTT